MSDKYRKAKITSWIFVFVLNLLSQDCVQGGQISDENKFGPKPKGTIKTIKNLDDGDVIDCVDIHKQPAFDDPRIKDLQMKPSSYPSGMYDTKKGDGEKYPELYQTWRKYGECPNGTIPIRRTLSTQNFHSTRFQPNEEQHEYATVTQGYGAYYGGSGEFNVWNPKTESREMSVSQIWVVAGNSPITVNSIESGWAVYPDRYKDSRTRLFISWTSDGYQKTGCWDLDCPGFVHVSTKIAIGSPIEPVSTYGGKQTGIILIIFKDNANGKWWFQLNDEPIGYWPITLFNYLQEYAEVVSWGGEIVNLKPFWHHTSTQMGSGQFPFQGYGKASFVRNLRVVDVHSHQEDAFDLTKLETHHGCYDAIVGPNATSDGVQFYFGGPGYSKLCT